MKNEKQTASALCEIALIFIEQAVHGVNKDAIFGAYESIHILKKYIDTGVKTEFDNDFMNLLEKTLQISITQKASKQVGVH